jgi:DNA-binding CsgD family transcriptional regulator
MPRPLRRFAPSEIERLRSLVAAGHTVAEIARRLSRHGATVSNKLGEIGLTAKQKGKQAYTPDELALLRTMVASGYNVSRISQRLNRSIGSIYQRCSLSHLPLARRKSRDGSLELSIRIEASQRFVLEQAAERRRLRPTTLVRRLIAVICADRLFDSVLDDSPTTRSNGARPNERMLQASMERSGRIVADAAAQMDDLRLRRKRSPLSAAWIDYDGAVKLRSDLAPKLCGLMQGIELDAVAN